MAVAPTNKYGAFTELVGAADANKPVSNKSNTFGAFGDLVPAGADTTKQEYGSFADLVPKAAAPEPKKPSIVSKAVGAVNKGISDVMEITPEEEAVIGQKKSSLARTAAYVPSELARHLPFGIGQVITEIQDDPETAAKVTFGDFLSSVPAGVVEGLKGFAKAPISGALSVVEAARNKNKPKISLDIPGLGKVSSAQFRAAERVAAGENSVVVALEEGATAIFDTLFFADIVGRVALPRSVKVAEVKTPRGVKTGPKQVGTGQPEVLPVGTKPPTTPGPKNFRLYEAPSATTNAQRLSPQAVAVMEKQGLTMSPKFDVNSPTYFRVTQGKGGVFKGEVFQVKPSLLSRAFGAVAKPFRRASPTGLQVAPTGPINPQTGMTVSEAGAIARAPQSSLEVLFTKEVKASDIEKAAQQPKFEIQTDEEIGLEKQEVKREINEIKTAAADEHADLVARYEQSGPSDVEGFTKADEGLSTIIQELEEAKAGERIMTGYGADRKVEGVRSTFPEWVPQELRSRELFDKVLPLLGNGTVGTLQYPPKGSRQRALFDSILNELDRRVSKAEIATPEKSVNKEKTPQEIVDYVDELDRSVETEFVKQEDRGILSHIKKQILSENSFSLQSLKIDDLIKNDPDLKEYVDAGEQRYVEGETPDDITLDVDNPIVVSSTGEIIDGYNRILTKKQNGEITIEGYVALPKSFKVNDIVKITDKETGKSQERIVTGIKPDGLAVMPVDGVGIPNKVSFSKWDISFLKEGKAPERGPGINSPEMIALEAKSPKVREDKPQTPEQAVDTYYNEVLAPALEKGKPQVVSADEMKEMWGEFSTEKHKAIYSPAAFKSFERALKENKETDVIMTGGGPGSGKTEIFVRRIFTPGGFTGVIYDTNFSSMDGARAMIAKIKEAGKTPKLFGLVVDLDRARQFTMMREKETGRDIPDSTFSTSHANWPRVAEMALKEGLLKADDVHIFDVRKTKSKEEVVNMIKAGDRATDPLALLDTLKYTRDELAQTYARNKYISKSNGVHEKPASREGDLRSPEKDRADRRQPDGRGSNSVLREGAREKGELKAPSGAGFPASKGVGVEAPKIKPIEGSNTIKPVELPELVDIARELMGNAPSVVKKTGDALGRFIGKGPDMKIKLTRALFDGDVNLVAEVLAHEIGHLIDYLPDFTLSRGNLIGRLKTLRKYTEGEFGGTDLKNTTLRAELLANSKALAPWKWTPEAMANKTYKAYVSSGKELYADAISMLFYSPGTLEQVAPTFYQAFFEGLDAKPEVKQAYFETQALLAGDRDALLRHRRSGVQGMFKEGDYKAIELQRSRWAEIRAKSRDFVFRLKMDVIDKNYGVIDRINELKKKGIEVPQEENPLYYLEERTYMGGKETAWIREFVVPAYENLKNAGVTWGEFGEALFYERIVAGDRSKAANPRGITPEAAKELLEKMKTDLGDKWPVVQESMVEFRKGPKTIVEAAFKEGMYSDELYQKMKENPAYVTFQVIDHLEEGVSHRVYKSIGTLKDITNPADATILKTLATLRAVERNKATRTTVDFLKNNFPEDIKAAEKQFTGKAQTFKESKDKNEKLVIYYTPKTPGKPDGVYVDEYIETSIKNESIGANNAIVSALRLLNSSLFRPLFIGYNLGFHSFNVMRDFKRFYKNIPSMTLARSISRYWQAFPVAKARAFGINPKISGGKEYFTAKQQEMIKLLDELEKDAIIGTMTYNDVFADDPSIDTQVDLLLRKYTELGDKPKAKYKVLQPVVDIMEFVKKIGDLIETLPKAAGFYEFTGGKRKVTKSEASYIRKYIGSPDFRAGGKWKPVSNEVFLFSNAIIQGIRSDVAIATNPTTRSGYWWKTAKVDFLPKIIMLLGLLGLFGKTIEDMMGGVSEYDRTNYTVIPIGIDSNGKTIYFRIPSDETGRVLSAIEWKIITAAYNEQGIGKDLGDIASVMGGQVPSITPVLSTANAIRQYLEGQNPYDFFRNQHVLSDDVFKAGGVYAARPFTGWLFNQIGGGIFYRYTVDNARPEDQSTVQKVMSTPVLSNIAGRWLRVSDYGRAEELRQTKEIIQRDEARERLDETDVVNDVLKRAFLDPNIGLNRRKYETEAVKTVFQGEPQGADEVARANRIVQKVRLGLVRGKADAETDALLSATSNRQKEAVLRQIKETMGDDQYKEFIKQAIRDKVISEAIAAAANRKE